VLILLATGTVFVFFFQAEDGIRDRNVTGVQTCALPILSRLFGPTHVVCTHKARTRAVRSNVMLFFLSSCFEMGTGERAPRREWKIGRASCRERAGSSGGGGRGQEEIGRPS